MHLSTDPGPVCDSPIASGPSESVHTSAGKRVLKRATKTRTGPKDGMCLKINFVYTHGQSAVIVIVHLSTDLGSVCDSPIVDLQSRLLEREY